ncbi:Cysteine protease atg4 [Ascosphaera pollenicola]|nr:Cysteine protease atg4 [Ascosphaera pollenicola]
MVQSLWQSEPRNDDDPSIPIWCLGKKYLSLDLDNKHDDSGGASSEQQSKPNNIQPISNTAFARDWPEAFLDDFESKLWLTYRSNFPPIPKSDDPRASSAMTLGVRFKSQWVSSAGFTSDSGWGCMIRSGQSLLANALLISSLGRGMLPASTFIDIMLANVVIVCLSTDWRRGDSIDEESPIISLFADDPQAPFSIHRFVEIGAAHCGKYPGQWFGPSATATCIDSVDSPDVYEDKLYSISSRGPEGFNPTLILLGVRLGLDRINPVYWEALASVLQMPQSVGIAGYAASLIHPSSNAGKPLLTCLLRGRPSSSLYFVGVQGSHFFYLDPHCTRAAPRYDPATSKPSREEIDSYHTRRLRRIHVEDMDPSMLLGFLVKDENDFREWKDEICSAKYKTIIHVSDNQPSLSTTQYVLREDAVNEVEALDDDEFAT